MKIKIRIFYFIFAYIISVTFSYAETVSDIDARAERYYKEKRFTEAIREWLSALDIDPANEKIQQKIEIVYEEKHKKNIALQLSKIKMKETYDTYEKDTANEIETNMNNAVNNFVVAYRIDPNDSEIKSLREKMEKFQRDMMAEILKKRRSEEDKNKYNAAIMLAKQNMDDQKFDEAIDNWNIALEIFENDPTAKEGKRKAELAISNRLKYEKIKSLMTKGSELFSIKQYNDALIEFKQVLLLDPQNDDAQTYISKIDDIIDAQQNQERKRQQAEQFYQAGIDDLSNDRFNEARDNFENTLSLISKYKDAEERIKSIKKLRDEYYERLKRQKLTEIDKEFESGLVSYAEGKYKEALSSFEKTIVLDPNNSLASSYLEKTKEALKEQMEEEIDESSPYFQIVSSLIVSGRDLYKKGKYNESLVQWEKIRSLFPKNKLAIEFILKCDLKLNPDKFHNFAERIVSEGKDSLSKKNYKKALSRFQMIKSISPEYTDIDMLIAQTTKYLKEPRKIINPTAVSQKEIESRYQMGIIYTKKGGENNFRIARDHFRFCAQNDPENMKYLIALNKTESQLRFGGAMETEQSTTRLTENQKKLVREYLFKGISYYSDNNYDKAIEEWRKVLAIDPTNEKAKNNIRKCLALLRR